MARVWKIFHTEAFTHTIKCVYVARLFNGKQNHSVEWNKNAAIFCQADRSTVTMTSLDTGVLLFTATVSMGTRTFVSGK